ncbi:MAG TPA: outer membrane protein assembly factor BamA [bacterium]|nr:outer membrane protein assembly factor BamA [bacterium]
MKRIFAAAMLASTVLLASAPAGAQTIREIRSQGNQRVEEATILATVESKVGMAYSPDRVRKDIQALYRLGVFDDVRVEKAAAGGGVRLVYIVSERSQIAKISFVGNKKVKEEKLRELIDVKPFGSTDAARLDSSIRKIQEHYVSEGYHLAEVTPEFRKIPGNAAGDELVFNIREGEPVRIKRINFIGNKVFSDKELRKKIRSKEKGYLSWLSSSGKYQDEQIKRDTAFLVYHYQNNGYLKVKVSPPQVYLSRDRKWLTVTFHIEEGEKYKVRNVDIEGDILTTKEELRSKFKLKGGRVYERKAVEEDLQTLSQIYGDQGYAFANINPQIQPHDEDLTADVTYLVQKGPRVYVERINISGNTITRDKVLRREVLLTENSLYNETRLRQSQQRLQALGYFEEVNFATPRGSADDRININITVKEKPTGTFSIGAGFSSAENFIFTASIAKQNFLGYGISGQFSTELSSKRQLFVLSFEDAHFLDSDWLLSVSGFRTVNVFTDFDRRSFGGSLSLGHRLFEWSSIRLGYQIEDVDVGDFRTTVPAVFNQNLSGLTSSASVTLARDTRNNRIFPTKGMYASSSVEYAGLGGDNEFLRWTENFRYYQPIWKGLVGKINMTIAQISSLNSLPVPLFERFFMGGVNSLRGYTLRSVGPSVQIPNSVAGGDNRFVYGGNKMVQFNFELEFPIYEPAGFRMVTFVDAGNSFAEDQNFALNRLRSDFGFGLRWNSPLGPLRFEWGIPFGRDPGEDPIVFNFTIGSFF